MVLDQLKYNSGKVRANQMMSSLIVVEVDAVVNVDVVVVVVDDDGNI